MSTSEKRRKKRVERIIIGLGFFISLALVAVCFLDNDTNLLTGNQQGYRLFAKKHYAQAAEKFNTPLWKGAAFYRDGQFDKAAAVYSGLDSPEGAFNHGNSLLMRGKYEEAIKRYERALVLKPEWQPAKTNLALARERAKALEKKGGEMTGGKLGADEYVFSNTPGQKGQDDEVVAGDEPNEAEKRAIWLRQVQTRPADFLRSKFAYQYQMKSNSAEMSNRQENGSEQELE